MIPPVSCGANGNARGDSVRVAFRKFRLKRGAGKVVDVEGDFKHLAILISL
jgi:hypothetical protein